MKYFYIILLLTSLHSANSQELQDNVKEATIIDIGEIESGGYGAFEMHVNNINLNGSDNTAIFIGARGGWIINSTFSIGGGGFGMVSKFTVDDYSNSEILDSEVWEIPNLQLGYGGFFLEYTHNSEEFLHLTVNTLIGAGGASYTSQSKSESQNNYNNPTYNHENSAFFVLEPGLTIELNILPFFRISSGISYRFVSGLNLTRTTNSDLQSISYSLAFKFGKF